MEECNSAGAFSPAEGAWVGGTAQDPSVAHSPVEDEGVVPCEDRERFGLNLAAGCGQGGLWEVVKVERNAVSGDQYELVYVIPNLCRQLKKGARWLGLILSRAAWLGTAFADMSKPGFEVELHCTLYEDGACPEFGCSRRKSV